MTKPLLIAVLAAMPVLCTAAEQPAVNTKEGTARAAPAPRFSQEQLDRIRASLVAQIAVYDHAERAMRAPTPEEAAALALPSLSVAPTVVPLAGGGVALRGDISHTSLMIGVRGDDGKVTFGHDAKPKAGPGNVAKEAAHVR